MLPCMMTCQRPWTMGPKAYIPPVRETPSGLPLGWHEMLTLALGPMRAFRVEDQMGTTRPKSLPKLYNVALTEKV